MAVEYEGSVRIGGTVSSSLEAATLKGLSDVNIGSSGLVDGQSLIYNTEQKKWINGTVDAESVLTYVNKDAFPTTGKNGKLYIDKSTNSSYIWDTNNYVEVGKSMELGETSTTAYAGDKGKANADAIASLQENKADKSDLDNKADLSDLDGKANTSDIEALQNDKADKSEISALEQSKADKATTLAGYGITDAATHLQGLNADTAVQSVKIGNTEYKSGVNVILPDYPTTLPASDVSDWAKAADKPVYTAAEVGALADTVTHLSGDIAASEKGVANGIATLDAEGKVPTSQLPSYVDDIVEYANKSEFPTTGESGKIYVDTTSNLTYRWSGSEYIEISPSIALGETASTAYAGDKGKALADKLATIAENAEVNVQSDWDVADTTSDAFIKNKPSALKNPNTISINGVSYDGSSDVTITTPNDNTTYAFTGGTNKFTVTPSNGAPQDIDITIDVDLSGKQDTLNEDQLAAINSGITADKAEVIDNLASVALSGDYNDLENTPDEPKIMQYEEYMQLSPEEKATGEYFIPDYPSSSGGGGNADVEEMTYDEYKNLPADKKTDGTMRIVTDYPTENEQLIDDTTTSSSKIWSSEKTNDEVAKVSNSIGTVPSGQTVESQITAINSTLTQMFVHKHYDSITWTDYPYNLNKSDFGISDVTKYQWFVTCGNWDMILMISTATADVVQLRNRKITSGSIALSNNSTATNVDVIGIYVG